MSEQTRTDGAARELELRRVLSQVFVPGGFSLLVAVFAWHPPLSDARTGSQTAVRIDCLPRSLLEDGDAAGAWQRNIPGAALANDYMTHSGRVFALADVLACASELHRARFAAAGDAAGSHFTGT
jgi:hypothetical protein